MSRDLGDTLNSMFDEGNVQITAYLDVYYDGVRTAEGIKVNPDWQHNWRLSANVPSSISCTAIIVDPLGESNVPRTREDLLAPYGQEVAFNIRFGAGEEDQVVQIGRFRVEDVDGARDYTTPTAVGTRVTSTEIDLTLFDALRGVELDGFSGPEQPRAGISCWDELGRLTGMRLLRSMPDSGMITSIAYELAQGGRLKACQGIADRIGGYLQITWDGALTIVPYEGVPSAISLETGDFGKIIDAQRRMSSDGVYNEVVGNFSDDKGDAIVVPPARQTTGVLRVNGPFGKRTRYYSSEFVKTRSAAISALSKILAQSLSGQRSQIPLRTTIDLRIEPGDNITVFEGRNRASVQILERRLFGDGRMELEAEVFRDMEVTS